MSNRLKAVVSVLVIVIVVATFTTAIGTSTAHADSLANRHSSAHLSPQCYANVNVWTDATYFYTNGPNQSYGVDVYSSWTCANWLWNDDYVSAFNDSGSYNQTQKNTCHFCSDGSATNRFYLPGPGTYGQCNWYGIEAYIDPSATGDIRYDVVAVCYQ
jgi:hypothetical protein